MDYKKWYQHQPQPITEVEGATILKEFANQSDWKIKSNRPDLVVKNYKRPGFNLSLSHTKDLKNGTWYLLAQHSAL